MDNKNWEGKIIQICPIPSNIRVRAIFKIKTELGGDTIITEEASPIPFAALTNTGEIIFQDMDCDGIVADPAEAKNFVRFEIDFEG